MGNENTPTKTPFWSSVPGILTAVGGIIGALAALITALYTAGPLRPAQLADSNAGHSEQSVVDNPIVETPSTTRPAETTWVDRTDAKSTATAVLTAYKARDVIAAAGINSAANRQIFLELAEQGESHPRYNSVFAGWRWQAVQAWNGQVGEVRYFGSSAQVKFGEIAPDEILVVTLDWENGRWVWDDIHSPSREYFESGSTSR